MLMSGFLYSWKRSIAASQNAQENQGGSENSDLRFSINPMRGESGFSQWKAAMKMVVQLPEGIPPEFRRKLWINLAEKYLSSRNVEWPEVEAKCFSEWAHPTDGELDVQIVKDLHRTGCSLFCGESGQEKQAVLKKVLLAYARWNKRVGYCQGFNMLAALILQVTEGCETDALKIMIFLIEGVLPESYFADSLRGLSVDMVVFRELLKAKLPRLSNHLDKLQFASKDGTVSYEPPLTNVFTMQWFLTIFCNCLPHTTVLRVWDLIFLEGNDVLLRTALAIWQLLEERIMTVRNADEFYCIMGVLTREMLELGLVNPNILIKLIMNMGPLKELQNLRDKYLYNINPWGTSNANANEVDRQLKLYRKENLRLDISALKKQYIKLKHRQRQAHIIFTAAVNKQPPPSTPPVAINHLLLGKSAIIPSKRIGPPKGSIPPPRQPTSSENATPSTLHWKDAEPRRYSSSSSSSDTELCDDPNEAEDDQMSEEDTKDKNEPSPNEPEVFENISDNTLDQESQICRDNKENSLPSHSSIAEVNNTDEKVTDKFTTCDSILNSFSQTSPSESTNALHFDVNKGIESSDSELDDSDFEKFLENRVKKLNISPLVDEAALEKETELERTDSSKESRQRALEIMQENSVILHRILQCQPTFPSLIRSPDQDSRNDFLANPHVSRPNSDTKIGQINISDLEFNEIVSTQDTRRDYSLHSDKLNDQNLLTYSEYDDYTEHNEKRDSEDEMSPNLRQSLSSNYKHSFICSDVNSLSSNNEFNYSEINESDKYFSTRERQKTFYLNETDTYTDIKERGADIYSRDFKKEFYKSEHDENKSYYNMGLNSPHRTEDTYKTVSPEVSKDTDFTEVPSRPTLKDNFEYIKPEIHFSKVQEEFSKELDKKYEELVLKPRRPVSLEVNTYEDDYKYKKVDKTEKYVKSGNLDVIEKNFSSIKKSPSKSPVSERVYDPFPIHISSRQNKDIGIRLGLYKK